VQVLSLEVAGSDEERACLARDDLKQLCHEIGRGRDGRVLIFAMMHALTLDDIIKGTRWY
jgi:hypothetical protein